MSPNENKTIYRRFYDELFNKGNLEIIDKLVAPNVISHSPFSGQKPGAEGFKKAIAGFLAAFPDLKAKAEDIIAEDDKVVGRFTVTGTHQGSFMEIAASGRKISYEEIIIVRFEDGKIVEHWSVADSLVLMQQLGLVPE